MASCSCVCARAQRSHKRRRTTDARVPTSKLAKVASKVKIKVESPEEVTCSTDDIRRQSTDAEQIDARRESCAEDALLPDTTTGTDHVADEHATVSLGTIAYRSQDTSMMDHSGANHRQPVVQTCSVSDQPYWTYQSANQYVGMHHMGALDYRDEADGRFYDDIDDVLSVMASVAGISQPHMFNH